MKPEDLFCNLKEIKLEHLILYKEYFENRLQIFNKRKDKGLEIRILKNYLFDQTVKEFIAAQRFYVHES
jgi:hypothetical protein